MLLLFFFAVIMIVAFVIAVVVTVAVIEAPAVAATVDFCVAVAAILFLQCCGSRDSVCVVSVVPSSK